MLQVFTWVLFSGCFLAWYFDYSAHLQPQERTCSVPAKYGCYERSCKVIVFHEVMGRGKNLI